LILKRSAITRLFRSTSLIFCLAICATTVHSQNQIATERLETLYISNAYLPENKLYILNELAINLQDSDKKLIYSQKLINLSEVMDSIQYLYGGYLEAGNAYIHKGDMTAAAENYMKAVEMANGKNQETQKATAFFSIANVYAVKGDYVKSTSYFKNSIEIFEDYGFLDTKDSINFAKALEGQGYVYVQMQKPDSAIVFLSRSGEFFTKLNDRQGIGYNLGNLGLAYVEKGMHAEAVDHLNRGIDVLEKIDDYYGISALLKDMANLYIELEDYQKASVYALQSLEMAERYGLKEQISIANLQLSQIYEILGDPLSSYSHFKDHITYRDSLHDVNSIEELADLRTNFEISQKQLEVDLLNQQKRTQRIALYSLGLGLVLIVIFYRRISREKNRSDMLLLNILPSKTAQELKENGKVKAKKFEAVTVMFTDFEAFTRYSHDLSPEKLVKSVDYFFSAFDKIMEKYGLEKIKTIGDAYMCTGGLAKKGNDQPIKVILAAFEILDFVKKMELSKSDEIAHFRIRIGINTGPVVGGVVGTKKFAYDIWGDTVNVAARMESNSEPCKVNISENTYQLVKDRFNCEYRGEIDVKNKGMMKMYFAYPKKKPQSPLKQQEKRINSSAKIKMKLVKPTP